ncbi:MAG: Bcr/CflA family multidrug efflux MFS transporter [Chitinophagaceae bacterium]
MTSKRYFLVVLILGTLSAIGPFSIDMYLPGFPGIAESLHTSVASVSLSLSSFFIGISAGQLLYGPLLDRFGRKNPIYFGLSLYILASLGCAIAGSIEALIAFRFLQALGGCAGMVAARALVRDIFPVQENARVFSLLMLVIGVSPMIAPTVGGYVTTHFGWHYIFIILAVLGASILTAVHFSLPEGQNPDASLSLRPLKILKNYFDVLIQPQFYTYVFTGSLAGAGLYAYISGSPYVFMELFKVTSQQYGWIFAFNALGLIIASQLNSVILRRGARSESIIPIALAGQALAAIALSIGSIFHWLNVPIAVGLLFLFLSCQGFIFPNSSALALAPFAKKAGSASALMGGIQMGIGAMVSAIVSWLTNNSALPMSGTMAVCAVTGLVIVLAGARKLRRQPTGEELQEASTEMVKTF